MATIFPASPEVGDTFSGYEWDGTSWNIIGIDLTTDYVTQSEFDAYSADSTDVHGIADTSALATQTHVSSAISTHNSQTTSVHGIADTSVLATQTYANTAANTAQSNAESYTDTAISNLVSSAPSTLDTLNELAAALGDDANFATTVTNSLSTKVTGDGITDIVALTQAEYDALTPDATTLYVVTD